jgi:hypothetical protein
MKTTLLTLAILALTAKAAAVPTALTVTPAEPTQTDALLLHVDVTTSTPCYAVRNPVAYVQNGTLHIDFETYDPGLYDCIQVIAETEFEITHAPLPRGTYPVVVHERQFYGPLLINEFDLTGEVVVTAALTYELRNWSTLKALYR